MLNNLFGELEFLGLNLGFWVSMGVVALFVVLQNVIFWNFKPYDKEKAEKEKHDRAVADFHKHDHK